MSISADPFVARGAFATYDPYPSVKATTSVFELQCRSCGFTPDSPVDKPPCCPKCGGQSWERFAKPGSILNNAQRYDN